MFEPAALAPFVREAMLNQMQGQTVAQAPTAEGLGKWPQVAHAAGNLADGVSTYAALRDPRNREGNPLLPNHGGAVLAIKAASILPENLLMRWIAKKGHPKIAKALGYGMGAAGGLATAGNVRHARRPR